MTDNIEILVFNLATLYASVHHSAREVCAQRGITLRELDLANPAHFDLAKEHKVRHFPQCLLYRNGRFIGETHIVIHSPASFAAWLDGALVADSNPA